MQFDDFAEILAESRAELHAEFVLPPELYSPLLALCR